LGKTGAFEAIASAGTACEAAHGIVKGNCNFTM